MMRTMTLALVAASAAGFGSALAAGPDLVPRADQMQNGTVSARNQGDADAGRFLVTVQCNKQGGGSCPDPGPAAMAPYTNPTYPNRLVVTVSGLKKGQVFNHKVPFFNALVWDPGSYNLLVEVDPGKTVTETDEGNNIYGTVYVAP
jgi:hypothetical protein